MSKTAMVHVRIDPKLKARAEKIMHKLGLTTSQVVSLLYGQIALHKGIPFDVKIPNKTTRKTFEKTDRGEDLKKFDTIEDLFKDLGI